MCGLCVCVKYAHMTYQPFKGAHLLRSLQISNSCLSWRKFGVDVVCVYFERELSDESRHLYKTPSRRYFHLHAGSRHFCARRKHIGTSAVMSHVGLEGYEIEDAVAKQASIKGQDAVPHIEGSGRSIIRDSTNKRGWTTNWTVSLLRTDVAKAMPVPSQSRRYLDSQSALPRSQKDPMTSQPSGNRSARFWQWAQEARSAVCASVSLTKLYNRLDCVYLLGAGAALWK